MKLKHVLAGMLPLLVCWIFAFIGQSYMPFWDENRFYAIAMFATYIASMMAAVAVFLYTLNK